MSKNCIAIILIGGMLFLSGCATIVSSPNQLVPISSTPNGANVLITDETGIEVFKGKTPTSVTLQKSDGSYMGGKDYIVTITKGDYEDQTIHINSTLSGWYLLGNFVFGGLIGWLIVDPISGAMYTLSPDQISANMDQKTSHNGYRQDGSINIVLLEDVPSALRTAMIRIH